MPRALLPLVLLGLSAALPISVNAAAGTPAELAVDSEPLIREWVPAAAPADAPAGTKFRARVRIIIDESGKVVAARDLAEESGPFGEAAVEAVKKWVFSPALDQGKAVRACVDVPFEATAGQAQKPGLTPPQRLWPKPAPRQSPEIVAAPLGEFPASLVGRGLPGEVEFECRINAEGRSQAIRVLRASHVDYVSAALEAYPEWKFKPAMQGDLAITADVRGEVSFDDPGFKRALILSANRITAPDGSEPEARPLPRGMMDPVYPADLLLAGEGGTAAVEFLVTTNGRVSEVIVREASAPAFGHALAAATWACIFDPALEGGRGVEVRLLRRHEFKPDADRALVRLVDLAKADGLKGGAGLDGKVVPIYRVPPVLSSAAKETASGAVAGVEFVIDRDGRARLPRIVTAPNDELGWAAATAVSQWIFSAPKRSGAPAEVKVQIPIKF